MIEVLIKKTITYNSNVIVIVAKNVPIISENYIKFEYYLELDKYGMYEILTEDELLNIVPKTIVNQIKKN